MLLLPLARLAWYLPPIREDLGWLRHEGDVAARMPACTFLVAGLLWLQDCDDDAVFMTSNRCQWPSSCNPRSASLLNCALSIHCPLLDLTGSAICGGRIHR